MRYSIEWEIQRLTSADFARKADALDARKDGTFSYAFPTKPSRLGRTPLTFIEYTCTPEQIQIQTHHTYPNELGLVVTWTQIELR